MKKLLFAMAVGAALAWLFDPDTGARRRASLKRKLDQSGMTSPAGQPSATPSAVTDLNPSVVATIP